MRRSDMYYRPPYSINPLEYDDHMYETLPELPVPGTLPTRKQRKLYKKKFIEYRFRYAETADEVMEHLDFNRGKTGDQAVTTIFDVRSGFGDKESKRIADIRRKKLVIPNNQVRKNVRERTTGVLQRIQVFPSGLDHYHDVVSTTICRTSGGNRHRYYLGLPTR